MKATQKHSSRKSHHKPTWWDGAKLEHYNVSKNEAAQDVDKVSKIQEIKQVEESSHLQNESHFSNKDPPILDNQSFSKTKSWIDQVDEEKVSSYKLEESSKQST